MRTTLAFLFILGLFSGCASKPNIPIDPELVNHPRIYTENYTQAKEPIIETDNLLVAKDKACGRAKELYDEKYKMQKGEIMYVWITNRYNLICFYGK